MGVSPRGGGGQAIMLRIEAIFHRFWIFVRISSLSRGKNCSPPYFGRAESEQTEFREWGDGGEAPSRAKVGQFGWFLPMFCTKQTWENSTFTNFHY